MGKHYDALKARLGEVSDLRRASAVLSWDQETYMPRGGARYRSEQLGTLSRVAHSMFIAPAIARQIKAAKAEPDTQHSAVKAAVLKVAERDYRKARRLPADFMAEVARTAAQAHYAWIDARATSNYALFAPWLKKNVEHSRRAADYLGWTDHPYDPLLDEYEPGMKTAEVEAIFGDLRTQMAPLIGKIAANQDRVSDTVIRGHFDKGAQERLGELAARKVGYDFHRGRIDYTTHPFCETFSVDDVRITTRIDEEFFNTYFFSILHEAGHAVYEQGVDHAWSRTPVEGGASLGMHESQSRMWENLVGRSREFWVHMYPSLIEHFPHMKDVPLEGFYRAINRVEPSLIRVEADEVTYNMHIMVRLEMEVALVAGKLKVKDVPAVWNAKYQEYLGITPPNDALGCLQDIHWSMGGLGYFSTYALGNIISAQLFERAEQDVPGLRHGFSRGEFKPLLEWLREKVYRHGRRYEPKELVKRITGKALTAAPYVAYLTRKYSDIYGL